MADSKISALPASTTPLAGTEVLPIVQSSTTRQVSVANLTAGRAISATQLTLTTGNLVVASGQGIDFSATPGTGTSELLNDYEEGTWTPGTTNYTGSLTSVRATYLKIGRLVSIQLYCATSDDTTSAGVFAITGLPFLSKTTTGSYSTFSTFCYDNPNGAAITGGQVVFNSTDIRMLKKILATSPTWSDWSGLDVNSGELNLTFTYEANA